jgi:hypothetical protein
MALRGFRCHDGSTPLIRADPLCINQEEEEEEEEKGEQVQEMRLCDDIWKRSKEQYFDGRKGPIYKRRGRGRYSPNHLT